MHHNTAYGLFKQLTPTLNARLAEHKVEELAQQLAKLAEQRRPTVMLYGLYNAGKSTLINALLGQEQALDGQVPTTSEVTSYQWQGNALLDTPGIDAPPEHEKVTEAQLQQSDLVIMVLSSRGATQELESYRTILRLLAQGQQVLVVVNSFDALQRTDQDAIAITDEILETLQRLSPADSSLLAQLQVVWVNAVAGLKAKQEQKLKLLNASGLPVLEHTLQQLIAHTDKADFQRRQAGLILPLLEQAEQQLAANITSRETQSNTQLATRLADLRQMIESRLLLLIEQQRRLLITRLGAAIKQPDNMDNELSRLNSQLATELEQALQQELRMLAEEFATQVDDPMVSPSVSDLTLNAGTPDSTKSKQAQAMPDLSGLLQGISKEQIQEAIELAQRMFPKLFGEVNSKVAERMASSVVRFNPWFMVLKELTFGIWNYYRDKREADELVQQQIRSHQQLRDAVEQTAIDYAQRATEIVYASIEMVFADINQRLAAQRDHWSQQSQQWAQEQQQLHEARLQLQHLMMPPAF